MSDRQGQLDQKIQGQQTQNPFSSGWYNKGIPFIGLLFLKKQFPNDFRLKKEDCKSQGQIGKNANLKNNGIKQMKEQGSHKSQFSSRFPQEGRYNQQIEQYTRNPNHFMNQRFLEKTTNDRVGFFILEKNLDNTKIQPVPVQLGQGGIGIDYKQLQDNCPS